MKKRKSGNSLERFKKVCERNGIILNGRSSDQLIIVDENGVKHTVGKDFNLFDHLSFPAFYKNLCFPKSVVLKEETDFKFKKEEIDYNQNGKGKISINYNPLTCNIIHKFENSVA